MEARGRCLPRAFFLPDLMEGSRLREGRPWRVLLVVAILVIAVTASCPVAWSATVVCEEDSCTILPPPPDDPVPGTLVPLPGNPPVHFPKQSGKKPPSGKKRHGKKNNGSRTPRG